MPGSLQFNVSLAPIPLAGSLISRSYGLSLEARRYGLYGLPVIAKSLPIRPSRARICNRRYGKLSSIRVELPKRKQRLELNTTLN